MKFSNCIALLIIYSASPAFAAEQSLSETVFEAGLQHIKQHGPDHETEAFVGYTFEHAWPRRREVIATVAPHLKSKNPEAVSGTLRALYRLRHLSGEAAADSDQEKAVAKFCIDLDEFVYSNLEHLFTLEDDGVLKSLALYCGGTTTAKAKRTLLRIVESSHAKNAREQALICIAWHNDASDMGTLVTYLLEDSSSSSSLPYHFRNSYGQASIPYLKQAVSEAARISTRLEAAFQLVHLRDNSGFRYLLSVLRKAPEADGKGIQPKARIRTFAQDYLELPKDKSSSQAMIEHLLMKQRELCPNENK